MQNIATIILPSHSTQSLALPLAITKILRWESWILKQLLFKIAAINYRPDNCTILLKISHYLLTYLLHGAQSFLRS